MTPNHARFLSAALMAVVAVSSAAAQTTVNIVADRDNTLYQDSSGSLSNGAGTSVFCGLTATASVRRALLRFDVAGSVPAGARILSAQLSLFVTQSPAFLPTNTFAHRVLQDWGEAGSVAGGGGGGGGPAQTGDATWLHTFFPASFWNNAGGDFAATASFVFPMPGLGAVTTSPSIGMVNDVQSWLDSPALNFGWLLKTDELLATTARKISSSEAATNRPTLTVTYLLPGQTASYGVGCPVGPGTFQLSVAGTPTSGSTVGFQMTGAPALSIGANFYSLALDPVGAPLFPGCTAYLPLGGEIIPGDAFLTDATGSGASALQIPLNSAGFLVNCQAAVIDATPLGISLSNSGLMLTQ